VQAGASNRRAGDNLFNLQASFGKYSRHSGINRAGPGYNSNFKGGQQSTPYQNSFMEGGASVSYQTQGLSPVHANKGPMQMT
jgi:hypothetical protein